MACSAYLPPHVTKFQWMLVGQYYSWHFDLQLVWWELSYIINIGLLLLSYSIISWHRSSFVCPILFVIYLYLSFWYHYCPSKNFCWQLRLSLGFNKLNCFIFLVSLITFQKLLLTIQTVLGIQQVELLGWNSFRFYFYNLIACSN